MIKFILGAIFGGTFGALLMAAMHSASETDKSWGWDDKK